MVTVPTSPGTRALRRGRFSQAGQVYHVTSATVGRQRLFSDFDLARAVVSALRHEAMAGRCHTLAFVVMPDHLHWLVQVSRGGRLARSVNNVKANSARAVNGLLKRTGRVWQKGYHDRGLRSDEDVVAVARYIIANPVRAGIVDRVGDYPHWDATWL